MKSALTKEDYIDRLNEELRRHPDFEDGMAFVPVPEGTAGAEIEGVLPQKYGRKKRDVRCCLAAGFSAIRSAWLISTDGQVPIALLSGKENREAFYARRNRVLWTLRVPTRCRQSGGETTQ